MKYDRSGKICLVFAIVFMMGVFIIPSAEGQFGDQIPGGQPDVTIETIGFSDESPMEDDNITMDATVLNNGTMPIKNVTLVFMVDNVEVGNVSDIELNSKTSETYEISWKAESGIHNVSAFLKYQGVTIQESVTSKELTVDPKPVGDVSSLLISLGIVALLVLLTNLLYSVMKAMRV